jgi:hypothetical protein
MAWRYVSGERKSKEDKRAEAMLAKQIWDDAGPGN